MALKSNEAGRFETSATWTGFRAVDQVVFAPSASPALGIPLPEAALSSGAGAGTGGLTEPAPFASALPTDMIDLPALRNLHWPDL
jgi:hypothetical protein